MKQNWSLFLRDFMAGEALRKDNTHPRTAVGVSGASLSVFVIGRRVYTQEFSCGILRKQLEGLSNNHICDFGGF